MARAKNLFQLEGKLSGLCIYKLNGKYVVRTIGKVPKEQYLRSKSFQRMRENMCEFGGSSQIGKALRELFLPYARSMADPYISGRLNAVLKKIISRGDGQRGQRTFDVVQYGKVLAGFEFNKHCSFESYFQGALSLTAAAPRNAVELNVASQPMQSPSGATHYRLVLAIGTLSNYTYDAELARYVALNKAENALRATAVSSELSLGAEGAGPIQLTAELDGLSALDADVGLVVCMGVEFLQEQNGVLYPLAEGNAMGVVGVF